MSEPMQPVTINIPSKKQADQWAEGFYNILVQSGIEPKKAMQNPMVLDLLREWVTGRMIEVELRRCLRNLLILNPALAAGRP